MARAIRFQRTDTPKQPGEQARLRVLSGPDRGSVYVITGSPLGIGRGESCDVVLTDLKTSRLHAEIGFVANRWQVRDLGSSNGIVHNGKEARQGNLATGDTIGLGETVLEFLGADAGAQALVAAPRTVHSVQQDQLAQLSQQERIKAITSFGGLGKAAAPAQIATAAGADAGKAKKLVLFAVVALLGVMFMLPEEKKGAKKKSAKSDKDKAGETIGRDLASYLPKGQSPEVAKTIQTFFRSGFREYREGNYLRAKSQFETVLQIDPSHSLARIYLKNSEQSIEDLVAQHFAEGKRDLQSGKINQAKGHYEAILRLLYKDQSSPKVTEAKEQLSKIETILKEDG